MKYLNSINYGKSGKSLKSLKDFLDFCLSWIFKQFIHYSAIIAFFENIGYTLFIIADTSWKEAEIRAGVKKHFLSCR